MKWQLDSLDDVLDQVWDVLTTAAGNLNDPLRFPALVSADETGGSARTMVLRAVNRETRELTCYTDARSSKVKAIQGHPRVEWLFHDTKRRLQVRAQAVAQVHHQDDVAREAWEHLPSSIQEPYRSPIAPGTRLDKPAPSNQESSSGAGEEGWPVFAVISTQIIRLDWLWQNQAGFVRAEFDWNGGSLAKHWLMP